MYQMVIQEKGHTGDVSGVLGDHAVVLVEAPVEGSRCTLQVFPWQPGEERCKNVIKQYFVQIYCLTSSTTFGPSIWEEC